ncbi:MAG: S41 family peptidase [Chloroflexia bacterium]|nr:S41 family peptidase [Chloroflexia bacterium]
MTDEHRPSPALRSRPREMSMAHFHVRMTGLFLLVLLVGVAGGLLVGRATYGADANADASFSDLDAVTGVLTENYYYRPTDDGEREGFVDSLEQNAISGMLTSLNDDYTRYLLPADAQVAAEQLEGEYGGIGVTLRSVDGLVSVARVGPDTPASRVGIRAGDLVERIDNRPVGSITENLDGIDLRGPVGSTVSLTVVHYPASMSTQIAVQREAIIVHPVAWEMIPDTDYMRIEIDIFGDRTTQELDEAIAIAVANDAAGIVLDLRGNGGGWVGAAQETIGRFLDDDVGPAMYEDASPARGGATELPIINGETAPVDLPLIVLVDGNTASAAEIVAGSLRDYDRALVVGEPTFGKGSVQRIFDFQDGASLRVTVAEWFTPSRGRIQDDGIRPDVLLTTDENATGAGDLFVLTATSFLDSGKSRPTDLALVEPAAAAATPTPSP